jgi:UDP-glucuronate 4-epimerase
MAWVVTGAAGFIGSHLCRRLLDAGEEVLGLDSFTPYYDVRLKEARVAELTGRPGFRFERLDLTDAEATLAVVRNTAPDVLVHLAAQPGVRYALEAPASYIQSNVVAFANVLEAVRQVEVGHLVYASSSSVYGSTSGQPFSEHVPADHPLSLYAATKRADELLAHSYSDLFGLPMTGLRFFTVYGPWGRPDMAYYAFTDAIANGRPIQVFGDGSVRRDFTYVDDIVEGIIRISAVIPAGNAAWSAENPDYATSRAPWRIYNIGHGEQVTINEMIAVIERLVGRLAVREEHPPVPGDVPITHADTSDLLAATGFVPQWRIEDGLAAFVEWHQGTWGR